MYLAGSSQRDACGNNKLGKRHYEFVIEGEQLVLDEVADRDTRFNDGSPDLSRGERKEWWRAKLNGSQFSFTTGYSGGQVSTGTINSDGTIKVHERVYSHAADGVITREQVWFRCPLH